MEKGLNVIPSTQEFSWIKLLLSNFTNLLNLILLFASLLSFLLGDNIDGIFILAVVILNSMFGFIQEFKAQRSLVALRQLLTTQARVIRDSQEVIIPTENIVTGDIVILSEGEKIPADGNLILGTHLEVDESILTGESIPVLKQTTEREDELFMGTTIMRGRGRMEVTQIGLNTHFGKIAKSLTEVKEEKTPLEKQLLILSQKLAVGIGIVGVLIFIVGVVQAREFFSLLLTTVSVAVAAIPEGLPAVITIALALGMERMAKKRSIVRKLASIETLGAIQVLLIDKTGTITRNQMRVKKVWQGEKEDLEFMLHAAVLGNSASLVEEEGGGLDIVGDKTDGALLLWASEKLGNKFASFKSEGKVVDEYAFDPVSKTVTVIWEKNLPAGRQGKKRYTFVRGAPEQILAKTALSSKKKSDITQVFEEYAKEGLRVIGFGYKEDGEKALTFLGIVGIYDPPREEAKESVKAAKEAGIRTVMVTGDNEITAQAIAQEVGLIKKGEKIINGETLEKMTNQELDEVLLETRVFARVKPQDKLRIVESYQRQGFVVGVTGDGVNDALALKKANVGVAMGKTGTDVAKEAGDLVITDDNFATIVRAIEEGRTIYSNITKSILYLLSCNLAEILTIFLSILLRLPLPLLPTQILWMNLVTDSLPALALASDIKDPGVLKRLPRGSRDYILSKNRVSFLAVSGFVMAVITVSTFYLVLQMNTEAVARTAAFTLLVFLQMAQAFIVRGFKNPFTNKFLIIAVVIPIILQILILTIPALQTIFSTH